MKNNSRKLTVMTTIVCFIPIIVGIVLYNRLPDTIAIHWDASGNPNGWASKFVGVIVLPGIFAILNLFVPTIMKMDPKYNNVNDKIKSLIYWIMPVICILCSAVTLADGLGYDSKVGFVIPLFCGLIFVIIGNYLPKTKQSYMVGIKLPWTLESEENWNKTHRMAGFLWVVCGLVIIIATFASIVQYILVPMIIVMVLVPTIYSYQLYKNNK